MSVLKASLSALFIFAAVGTGSTQNLDVKIIGRAEKDLKPQALYSVEISCRPLRPLRSRDDVRQFFGFAVQRKTLSHFVALAYGQPTPSDKGVKLPDSIIATVPLYSMRAGADPINNLGACRQKLLVNGNQPIYLIASQVNETKNEPGLLLRLLWKIPEVVPPLWALITNDKLSDHVVNKFGTIGPTKQPITDLLTEFDSNRNSTATVDLTVGQYNVRSLFSETTLVVKPVKSVLNAGFGQNLRELVDRADKAMDLAAKEKAAAEAAAKAAATKAASASDQASKEVLQKEAAAKDAAAKEAATRETAVRDLAKQEGAKPIDQRCRVLASDLLKAGFSEDVDVPYALAYFSASKGTLNQDGVLECLSDVYALNAAKIKFDVLWRYIDIRNRISEELVLETFDFKKLPIQPGSPKMSVLMDDLIHYLSIRSKTGEFSPKAKTNLPQMSHPQVSLVDKTRFKHAPIGETKGNIFQVADFLIGKGITRFGCYSGTSTGTNLDGARVMITAYIMGTKETETDIQNVIVIRPVFSKGKIFNIHLRDEPAWVDEVLKPVNDQCGPNLAVKRPTKNNSAQPVAATPAQ
jgi:hypothetical protein